MTAVRYIVIYIRLLRYDLTNATKFSVLWIIRIRSSLTVGYSLPINAMRIIRNKNLYPNLVIFSYIEYEVTFFTLYCQFTYFLEY